MPHGHLDRIIGLGEIVIEPNRFLPDHMIFLTDGREIVAVILPEGVKWFGPEGEFRCAVMSEANYSRLRHKSAPVPGSGLSKRPPESNIYFPRRGGQDTPVDGKAAPEQDLYADSSGDSRHRSDGLSNQNLRRG